MYSQDEIKQHCGQDALDRVQRKNRGGVSNEKGNTYENLFAVYQIAKYAQQVIENRIEIKFYAQILAFVDDLIIDSSPINLLSHFQLKNSPQISWETDKIAEDFRQQYRLNQSAKRRESQLYLVVSDQRTKNKREADIPADIKPYSQVFHFPYTPNPTKLIQQQPDFNQAIRYLCAFENPEPDKLEMVLKALLGAWVLTDKSEASAINILTSAQECNPSYIRSFLPPQDLDPEVKDILDRIELFTYNLDKGFFHWEYAGELDSGTFPQSIETQQFRRFQNWIKQNQPATFDEIESLLVGSN